MKTTPVKNSLPTKFPAFLLTQALGALNDNLLKMLLQLYILQVLILQNTESLISGATFLFTLPYVLFGPWAGYLADKYSKSGIMKTVKMVEIPIMLLAFIGFYLSNLNMLLAVLFLMSTQSTFFSPAKYGYIPEACKPNTITKANAWMEMSTFAAIIVGSVLAGVFMVIHNEKVNIAVLYCLLVAVLGAISCLFIDKLPAKKNSKSFPWDPFTSVVKDLIFLKKQKGIFLAALANSYFWGAGLLFQTNILMYAKNMLEGRGDTGLLISLMPAFMGIGIACGSLLASRWSGSKIELGLVPLGGLGMGITAIMLYFTSANYYLSSGIIFTSGVFAGLFIVPLYSFLQFYSEDNEKGRVMAANGIMNGLFLVLASVVYYFLVVKFEMGPQSVFLLVGGTTILVVGYICTVIPEYAIRFGNWLLTHTLYKITIIGQENVPLKGPAILAPNHVSFVDAFLIGATVQRFIRFIMLKYFFEIPIIKTIFKIMNTIPISPKEGRDSVGKSLKLARSELVNNHVVCIFPEGKITQDGNMNEFRPGFENVIEGLDCPIIPVYLHNVWGSIFSYSEGKVLFKWPKRIPYKVTICYGKPMPSDSNAAQVEAAVKELQTMVTSG